MTKKISKKNNAPKKIANAGVSGSRADVKPCVNSWSLSIYIYWFIILFFIAATFYILGRSHGVIHSPATNNVEITEESLMQSNDYYESGKTKLLNGNIDDAIADLTVSIDAGNASVETYILRGEAYMQSSDYRRAMDDFNAAIEKNPSNAIAYYDRSLLNARLENYGAALADINNALAANVNDGTLSQRDLYAKRGQLNLWMKNWEGAIADFTNSLARPEGIVNPSVYAERAEAYTALGNYTDAINDYASAVRVISEQIQGASTSQERESLSGNAMSYFEKSAALNLKLGNIDAARSDLESSYTIAAALNDVSSMERLQGLLMDIQE